MTLVLNAQIAVAGMSRFFIRENATGIESSAGVNVETADDGFSHTKNVQTRNERTASDVLPVVVKI